MAALQDSTSSNCHEHVAQGLVCGGSRWCVAVGGQMGEWFVVVMFAAVVSNF